MKKVHIRLTGLSPDVRPRILVNGESVKYKKNRFGSYEIDCQTEEDEIELTVFRYTELSGRLWWLFALLSFIISVFGIFEPPYDKRCIVMDCRFRVKPGENSEVRLKFNSLCEQGRAAEIETDCEVIEVQNGYGTDRQAKKRRLALRIGKWVIWVLAALLAVYYLTKHI